MSVGYGIVCKVVRKIDVGDTSQRRVDRGASAESVSAGGRSGCVRAVGNEQAVGRGAGEERFLGDPLDSLGDGSGVREAAGQASRQEAARRQAWASRFSTTIARTCRLAGRASRRLLPRLRLAPQALRETRVRYTEDIPDVQPETTEHTIHRDWCPQCRKKVEPPVTAALPGCLLGNRVLALSAWLHYALGNTLSQIVEVFNFHLQFKITPGGLVQMWQRLQELLYGWYEQIQQEALDSAVLHGDETGWRNDGQTNWLWSFGNQHLTYYLIDRSRGSPALAKFFIQEFAGTLVTDFWGAYNAVSCAARQTCLVHLLRELEQTEQYKSPGAHWSAFAKKLRRLVGDAIRLWRRKPELSVETYASRRDCLDRRLAELVDGPWEDPHSRRLVKRLRRHQYDLFTFLDQAGVPFDNNHAERSIRPAVILRKNSYGNRSQRGTDCQAVLMSVFRTLKQRGHDPIQTVVQAIEQYLAHNTLPHLPPPKIASDG